MGLFGAKAGGFGAASGGSRVQRHSSGWAQLSRHLGTTESLRILDIGPTSAGNINFITNLGHSIYMANLVEDAARPEYSVIEADTGKAVFDVDRFLKENLDFAGRTFDVVTLWDTPDYLPAALIDPVITRIYDVMEPGGQLLAFFHSKPTGDDTVFSRCHLTGSDKLDVQRIGSHPIRQVFTTRQVETLFKRYKSHKFFLAKDTIREVIVIR